MIQITVSKKEKHNLRHRRDFSSLDTKHKHLLDTALVGCPVPLIDAVCLFAGFISGIHLRISTQKPFETEERGTSKKTTHDWWWNVTENLNLIFFPASHPSSCRCEGWWLQQLNQVLMKPVCRKGCLSVLQLWETLLFLLLHWPYLLPVSFYQPWEALTKTCVPT